VARDLRRSRAQARGADSRRAQRGSQAVIPQSDDRVIW
jgi:hypothetical protein